MPLLRIDTLPTPNPDALMFKVEVPLVERGTYEYVAPDKAVNSPLPRMLFTLAGVAQVLVTSRFVTVNKVPQYDWPELVPGIKGAIRAHLDTGEAAVDVSEVVTALDTDSELARQIVELIDEEIRPAVAQDGGDCQFVGLTDENVVQVRLIGSCASCPSATATLALGIERLIVEEFPDVQGVIQV
ncbi:MAG: NifU family protein [Proteobacteria bacterium]|nr:NifU family protein [Pseudomonadota bacterium]MCP4921638.1 NifU family protein [Pseudomonadota bacterium]